LKQLTQILLGLALLIGILAATGWLLWKTTSVVLSLDKEVSAVILTGLFSVIALVYTQYLNKKRDIRESHRDTKTRIYNDYMALLVDLIKSTKEKDSMTDAKGEFKKEILEKIYSFKRDIILWGSSDVILAQEAWESAGLSANGQNVILLVDSLIRAMRKDLGNSNWKLKDGTLICLFITDMTPDQLKEASKSAEKISANNSSI
jgi:hypothetical protein